MLRFLAYEIMPNYQITPNWSVSAVYLQGNVTIAGPQETKVLFLNTSISNIKLGGDFRFQLAPSFYFLNTDGYTGKYLSLTGILSKKRVLLPYNQQ
jgi:hypothetical protein